MAAHSMAAALTVALLIAAQAQAAQEFYVGEPVVKDGMQIVPNYLIGIEMDRHPPGMAMGKNAVARTDEDEMCALHLRNLLEGRTGDANAVRQVILAGGEAGRFRDASRPWLHPEDLDIALEINRYDFAIRVTSEDGRPVGRMERTA